MQPPAEHVHWVFATGFLLLGLLLLAEAIVGEEVWASGRGGATSGRRSCSSWACACGP